MKIKSIELINFRNYKNYTFVPNNDLNIITGPNGSGKTNLVEAIFYLSFAKGFKNKTDQDLVNENSDEFVITSTIENDSSTHKLNFYYNKNKSEKKVLLNGKQIHKLSELNKVVNALLFIPSMADLFKNSPSDRRDYFDRCISKISDKYSESFKRYKNLLKERNLVLKNENPDINLIKSIDKQLINISKTIISFRAAYIQRINSVICSITEQISNKNKKLELIYAPILKINQGFENELFNLYQKNLEKDIRTQTTSIGIHKEDYFINIDGKDISIFGSQAENRIAVVALVLSSYFIIKEDAEKPIVILDDVLSELDENNRERLIKLTKKLSQVFITSTETSEKEYEKKITEAEL